MVEVFLWLFTIFYRLVSRKPKSSNDGEFNILLFDAGVLGDVTSLSVMIAPLKKHFPQSKIYILTKSLNKDVYQYDDRIEAVLTADFLWTDSDQNTSYSPLKRWKNLFIQLLKFKSISFDVAFEPRGDIRSQFVLNILQAKEIVGYTTYIGSNITNYGLMLDKKVVKNPEYIHRFDANCYMLMKIGIPENEIFPIVFPSFKTNIYPKPNRDYFLIHVGGSSIYKLRAVEKWISLINKLLETYDLDVHLVGGQREEKILSEINFGLQTNERLTVKMTTFDELVEEILNCSLFIGLDSGPLHLAQCLGRKVVGLFGPGISVLWKPYSEDSKYIHKIHGFTCHPCRQETCLRPENSCMDAILVSDVADTISRVEFEAKYQMSLSA